MVVDELEAQRVLVDRLEREVLVLGRRLPVVAKLGKRPFHRVAQEREGHERRVEQLDRAAAGSDP